MKLYTILLMGLLLPVFAGAAYNATQVLLNTDTGFTINNFIQTPDRIYPGDQVRLGMSFHTTKLSATDVSAMASTPFLATSSEYSFGAMQKDAAKPLTISFTVPTTTKPGTYPVYLYAGDANTPQKQVAIIQTVVNAQVSQGVLMAEVRPREAVQTGKTAVVNIEVTNTGNIDARDVIIELTNKSAVFTAIESNRKYVPIVAHGKTETIPFTIGVAASASPGYYPLTVGMQYAVDNVAQPAIQQDLGVRVDANPSLLITTDQQYNSDGTVALSLNIANVGDTAVRGVYVKATSPNARIIGANDKFIGTLNLDDSSTIALTLSPRPNNTPDNPTSVDVMVSFKDPVNVEHTINETLALDPTNVLAGAGSAARGAPASQRFNMHGGNRGFLGLDLFQWGGMITVLAAAGFFGYRWYKRRKK